MVKGTQAHHATLWRQAKRVSVCGTWEGRAAQGARGNEPRNGEGMLLQCIPLKDVVQPNMRRLTCR